MKTDFLSTVPYICERWQEVSAASPSAAFLTEEVTGKTYSRKQADELSACVYSWLLKKGIGTEDFVFIRMPRDARPFIAMLGVWKAGAAFTVTEDSYAPERIRAIREDCACAVTIDEKAWAEILETEPAEGYRKASPNDACFAIYTSGSTGKPKGVVQEYGKIQLNQASMERKPGDLISESTCMAMLAPLNFIAAVKIFMNAVYSGMHLVVFSMDTARDPVRMNEQFNRFGITLAFLSPSVLRVMENGPAGSLKTLVTGSESANGIFFDGVRLINNYGMSEAGFHVAQFTVDRRYDFTPIGKPVYDAIRIRLLDEDGRDVPDGAEGEICFDNPFFRGYLHMPEETARVLRGGIFHSGDMGRRQPDGDIVVTGRLNTMVKINGNRVEPGETEAALRKIPGIRDAAVKDFRNERQQVFLCGYYTADGTVTEEMIRTRLSLELPHYMIPAFLMKLDRLPLNRNGKVDRQTLPEPDANTRTQPYAAPRTPKEKKICEVFGKVLRVDEVGIHDDFFALGGDSLSTAAAAAELEDLRVDYRDIYAWKTPERIAERLAEKQTVDLKELNRIALEKDQRPTPYQIYFYDAQLYAPRSTCLNNYIGLKFRREEVDAAKLKTALETVFSHYAVFSSVFTFNEDGELVIRHVPGRIIHPEIHPVEAYTDELILDFIRPFRLNNELMYRCAIYTTAGQVILAIDTSHLISDGTTMANLMSEIFAAYHGNPLKEDYYFYYLQEQYRRRMILEQEEDMWQLMKRYNQEGYLSNPPPDRISRRSGNGRYVTTTHGPLNIYRDGCAKLHTSMNKLFVAASLIALSRCGDRKKVTVEWTYHGRDESWKQDLIGITIAAVPIAVDLEQIHSPEQLLKEIDEQSELGIRYADCSLGNSGVTPGERDRVIVVYESGFAMESALPENTEMITAYDKLNAAFTRFQYIIFDSSSEPEKPVPFYINYDSESYSLPLAERAAEVFRDALDRLISGGI